MISLFTANSGKTNQSAPVCANEENSSIDGGTEVNGSSPLHSKFKDSQILAGGAGPEQLKLKKKHVAKNKIRPASSLSPG